MADASVRDPGRPLSQHPVLAGHRDLARNQSSSSQLRVFQATLTPPPAPSRQTVSLTRYLPDRPNSVAQNDAHQQILNALREARIMDGHFGRKLPESRLVHGLELQFAEIDRATARFGEPEYEWMRTTILGVTAKLLAAG